ncbi:MAG: lamin tail domain-containing protein, partial [Acetobacteraceae bacterium]
MSSRLQPPSCFTGSLDNDGDTVAILRADGALVHAVTFSKDDYGDPVKQEGGWSLELIDAAQPCRARGNWTASRHPRGGTPGQRNAAAGSLPDVELARLLRSYVPDSTTVVAVFSSGLDSAAAVAARYTLSNGTGLLQVECLAPLFREVRCRLTAPLPEGAMTTLELSGLSGCPGTGAVTGAVPVGRALPATAGSVVFNEVLYAPAAAGAEFVELLHRGRAPVNLQQLYLAARTASGAVGTPVRLSDFNFTLFPGDHLVLSDDPAGVRRGHLVANDAMLLRVSGMPALSDGGASLLLLNAAGVIIDELRYSPDWQFALVQDPHGVSLERIDPDGPTQDAGNWHSAAHTAGYGTPT